MADADWDGKSKGSLIGYKIFIFSIKNLGIRFSYLILFFVALYYFIFLKQRINKVRWQVTHSKVAGYSSKVAGYYV